MVPPMRRSKTADLRRPLSVINLTALRPQPPHPLEKPTRGAFEIKT